MPDNTKKEMRLRLKARVASQSLQSQLVARAKRLAEDPGIIIPVCETDEACRGCPWDSLKADLERVKEVREYETKLRRKANGWGDDIVKAYADTLMIRLAGKAPFLSEYSLKTPEGIEKIPFSKRGKANNGVIAGVQNYHHPMYRILIVQEYIKKGYWFNSYGDRLVCSGKEPNPPEGFVDDTVRKLSYDLKKNEKGNYSCPHAKGTKIVVKWLSAKTKLSICESCVIPNHRLISSLTNLVGSRNPEKDYEASIKLDIHCVGEEKCSLKLDHVPGRDILLDFLEAKITDSQFLEFAAEDALKANLESLQGKQLFVAAGKCYGKNTKDFVLSFQPNDEERLALFKLVKEIQGPIITDRASAAKLIEDYWKDYGKQMVEHVAKDPGIAEEIWDPKKKPVDMLHLAMSKGRYAKILSEMPEYTNLPEVADFCDRLAKTFKIEGKPGAVRLIIGYRGHSVKVKSIAYAGLLMMEEAKGKEWKFTNEEREFAIYLKDFVNELFNSKGETYHRALQNLLAASGSGERIELRKGG